MPIVPIFKNSDQSTSYRYIIFPKLLESYMAKRLDNEFKLRENAFKSENIQYSITQPYKEYSQENIK